MKKYKILLFDLDDTLVDDEANIRYAIKKLFIENKYSYDEEDIKKWINNDKLFWKNRQKSEAENPTIINNEKQKEELTIKLRSERFLLYFDYKITLEKAIELNNNYNEYLLENVVPLENAFEVIRKLSNKYKIQIITNGPHKPAVNKIKKIECSNYIENIYSAEKFGLAKPKNEYINLVKADMNNFNNEDYLIVGDSLRTDIKLGMNSNIDTCWINFNNEELEDDCKPTYIVNNLEELLEIL